MANDLGIKPSNTRPFVFVSYTSEDKARVSEFLKLLSKTGINIWYDHGLVYGDPKYWETISENIDKSTVVMMFISNTTIKKGESGVFKEYALATEFTKDKVVIPVLLEKIDMGRVPHSQRIHVVSILSRQCFDFSSGAINPNLIEKLSRNLQSYLSKAGGAPQHQKQQAPQKTAPKQSANNKLFLEAQDNDRKLACNIPNSNYPNEQKVKDIQTQLSLISRLNYEQKNALRYKKQDLENALNEARTAKKSEKTAKQEPFRYESTIGKMLAEQAEIDNYLKKLSCKMNSIAANLQDAVDLEELDVSKREIEDKYIKPLYSKCHSVLKCRTKAEGDGVFDSFKEMVAKAKSVINESMLRVAKRDAIRDLEEEKQDYLDEEFNPFRRMKINSKANSIIKEIKACSSFKELERYLDEVDFDV